MADNSKVVPKLLETIGSCIAGKAQAEGVEGSKTSIGYEGLRITSAFTDIDRDGDVLIVFLSNGQSLKVRATPFGRATV
jgi:hypothetical protein